MIEASAPGKLVLSGEYAVLCGAPAVAVAMGARARVTVSMTPDCRLRTDGDEFAFRFDRETGVAWPQRDPAGRGALLASLVGQLRHRLPAWPPAPVTVSLDSSRFHEPTASGGATKLGLGSSAAVMVAMAGALARAWGLPADGDAVETLCLEAHRGFQGGRGSGIDIATALRGQVVSLAPGDVAPAVASLGWPAALRLIAVWSGRAASTADMIDRFDSCRARPDDATRSCLRALCRHAEAAALAWQSGEPGGILQATAAYAAALEAFDRAAGIGIVTEAHRQLASIAADHGAVYKSSGAGGGDLGMALTDSDPVAAAVSAGFRSAGFRIVDLPVAVPGLRVAGTAA